MEANEKRLAAALAAVSAYIQTEEEALVMPAPKRPEPRRFEQGNLWGTCRPTGHDADAQPHADENLQPTPLGLGTKQHPKSH